MARIIHTSPDNRTKLSLRVGLSLLLFLQIQVPDAKVIDSAPAVPLSFKLTGNASAELALHKLKPAPIAFATPLKAN